MQIKGLPNQKNNICASLLLLFLTFNASFSQLVEVRGNNTISVNGELFPSTTDFTDLGSVPTRNKLGRTFILKNTGNSTLVFPSTNIVVSSNATQSNIF